MAYLSRFHGNDSVTDFRVGKYLEKVGFRIFSSDGKYFHDEDGRRYAIGGFSENGEIRTIREINPKEDVFQLLHEFTQCYQLQDYEVNFLIKSPLPSYYNVAVVRQITSWRESGEAGYAQNTLYSMLMLKADVTNTEKLHKGKAHEEQLAGDSFEDGL